MSAWECEEPTLKKVWFEKRFTHYPHIIVYDSEVILAPINEHPTDNVTYLSKHILISIPVHDPLSKELVYLVGESLKRLLERFIEIQTEKQEAIAADVLKQHPYPLDSQMLPDEVKKQWRQWVNQISPITFNSGKYDRPSYGKGVFCESD